MREIHVANLGTMPYTEAWALQKSLVARRAAEEIGDTLLLVEHPHVFTFGRRAQREGMRGPDGYEWHYVERGGLATYHGPGQLVGYPIFKIGGLEDVKAHITGIEEALIRALRGFGIDATRRPAHGEEKGHTGVWVAPGGAPNFREEDDARRRSGGTDSMRKVASIGVAVEGWVTYHGFALNVDPDMGMFGKISPCGLAPESLVCMTELLGRRASVEEVCPAVIESCGEAFDGEIVMIDAGRLQAATALT